MSRIRQKSVFCFSLADLSQGMVRLLLWASVGAAGVCCMIFTVSIMSVGRPRGVQMLQEDLSLLGHEQQLAKAARIRRQIKTGVAHGTMGMGIGGAHPVPPPRICAWSLPLSIVPFPLLVLPITSCPSITFCNGRALAVRDLRHYSVSGNGRIKPPPDLN